MRDILRPGLAADRMATTLSPVTGWSVIDPARLAVLDGSFSERLAHYPELIGKLVNRALLRCKHVSVHLAIVHQARVDVRLHMLFWHLAGRWGKVRSDGTLIPLRLTHAVLGDLVAARRLDGQDR